MGIAHSNNGISSPDPSIDTEMGTKDDDNGYQDEDVDETLNEDNNPSNASDAKRTPDYSSRALIPIRTKILIFCKTAG
jgi:hypothetical protein